MAGAEAGELWARVIQEARLAPDVTEEVESLWAKYRAIAGATTDG